VDCSLFYLALKKKTVLQGLWRMASWNKEQGATQRLLANNFEDPKWKTTALKNAYALLSKRRFREWSHCAFNLFLSLLSLLLLCIQDNTDQNRIRGSIFPTRRPPSRCRECVSEPNQGSPTCDSCCSGIRRRSGSCVEKAIGERRAGYSSARR
jgi:hypothetical protein